MRAGATTHLMEVINGTYYSCLFVSSHPNCTTPQSMYVFIGAGVVTMTTTVHQAMVTVVHQCTQSVFSGPAWLAEHWTVSCSHPWHTVGRGCFLPSLALSNQLPHIPLIKFIWGYGLLIWFAFCFAVLCQALKYVHNTLCHLYVHNTLCRKCVCSTDILG